METINLGKGMNLRIIQTNKFKTTTLCMLLRRPLTRDEATINAVLPGILKSACAKYDSVTKLNRVMEGMYGSVFDASVIKKGEDQIIQFLIEVVNIKSENNILAEALDFLSEVVLNPLVVDDGFSEQITAAELTRLKQRIESRVNDTAEYAKLRCLEEMCKNESFGVYGDGYIQDLSGITARSAYWHYKRMLKESPIDFVAIGDINAEFLKRTLKEKFPIDRENIIKISKASIVYDKKDPCEVNEPMEITQGKICIGLRSGIKPDGGNFFKLMVFNELLGGGPDSWLFRNVREKESLCYTINSFVYRFKGIVMVQSGASTECLSRVKDLIQMEISAAADGRFDETDLNSAKTSLNKKFESLKDFPSSIMDFYMSQYMIGDESSLDVFLNGFGAVTKDDVQKIAGRVYMDTVFTLAGHA